MNKYNGVLIEKNNGGIHQQQGSGDGVNMLKLNFKGKSYESVK